MVTAQLSPSGMMGVVRIEPAARNIRSVVEVEACDCVGRTARSIRYSVEGSNPSTRIWVGRSAGTKARTCRASSLVLVLAHLLVLDSEAGLVPPPPPDAAATAEMRSVGVVLVRIRVTCAG